jgi:hypothetical protein
VTDLPPELEALLTEHIRDRKRTHLKTAIGVPALFFTLAPVSYFVLGPPERNLWVLCVGMGLLGLLFFIPALGDPRAATPLRVLRDRPQDIVWFYAHVIRNKATSWILLRMANGKLVRLPAKFGAEDALVRALAAHLPHATFGFSSERDAQYRRDPGALRRKVGA